jgi:hypothetical protein
VEGEWRRADLHLHTPASADWLESDVTWLQWLQKAEARSLDIVAITDHNTVEGVARLRGEIERLTWLEANDRLRPQERRDLDEYRRLGEKVLVLPGFEFTATFGFHVLAIFPSETPLRTLELLLLRLNVPIDRLAEGSTEVGATTDVLAAYRLMREAGAIVLAPHANSAHGVAMRGFNFGGQTKIAYTQDLNLHALEVTDLEDAGRRSTARFFDGSKPEYPRRMHCIQGSDAHRLVRDQKDKNRLGIGDRATELLLPEVSFAALRVLFEGDDFSRTRPYRPLAETPFDHVEAARTQGNNIVQAFHESMTREGGRFHKVLCDVVAFANTSGGTIYIGVSATRKGAPKGVENAEAEIALLKREIERSVTPPLDVRVDTASSQGVAIVRVAIPNGPDKPYALNQTRIFMRQEAETNEAVRDEIVQMVLAGRQMAAPLAPESVAAPGPTAEPVPPIAAAAPPVPSPEPVAAPAEPPAGELMLPGIGVEIVTVEERKGGRYFTIRDLRNSNVVQNVTLASARKLWSYAINQYLTNPVDPERVTWRGDYGLWQAGRRAKKLRYDLALRQPDGTLRIFYGVTADGMTGSWTQFLQAEDRAEGEAGPQVEIAIKAEPATEIESQVSAPAGPLAPVPATTEAEPKRKPRARRRKATAEIPAQLETKAEATVETDGEAQIESETQIKAEVEVQPAAEAKPEAQAEAVPEVANEVPVEVMTRPKSRSRRRKTKIEAQPEAIEPTAMVAAEAPTPGELETPVQPQAQLDRGFGRETLPNGGGETLPGGAAETEPVKKSRSRSRKAKAQVQTAGEAQL